MATKTAVVLGGSGGIGKGIVRALANAPQYEQVTLIGRKPLELPLSPSTELPEENCNYAKFDQKIMDFDKLGEYDADFFKGYDVGFYAIGVSQTQVTEEVYRKIELDNAIALGKLLKSGEVKDVHWVTGSGTSENSWFLFGKVKAQVEATVGGMGFRRASFYRPGGVLTSDKSGQMGPKVAKVMKAIDCGNRMTIHADILGKAMVTNSLKDEVEKVVEIFENTEMNKMGKMSVPK